MVSKLLIQGEAGHSTWKFKEIKAYPESVNLVNGVQHLAANIGLGFTTVTAGGQSISEAWYLDSAATTHVCNSEAKFIEYAPALVGEHMLTASKEKVYAVGVGTVGLRLTSGEVVILKDVLHVPSMTMCLVSVSKLNDDGFGVFVEHGAFVFIKNNKFIGGGYLQGGLYRVAIDNSPTSIRNLK